MLENSVHIITNVLVRVKTRAGALGLPFKCQAFVRVSSKAEFPTGWIPLRSKELETYFDT
jgi:hypothetical protein